MAKKFPLAAVLGGAAGVGVIAVAAYLTMGGGKRPQLGAAAADTTKHAAPAPTDTQTASNASQPPATHTSQRAQAQPPRTTPVRTQSQAAHPASGEAVGDRADRELLAALDRLERDTSAYAADARALGFRYWNLAPPLPALTRAKAAEVIAQSYGVLNDNTNYNVWHGRAAELDPRLKGP